MIESILRIFRQLFPVIKARVNKKPGREVKENFDDRPHSLKYTSDVDIMILKDFLTPNKYSRPCSLRVGTKAIEIHWVANPNTSAKMNRNYFELRKGGKHKFGSTQFLVDLDGDIIQAIPERERAYSSGAKRYKDGIKAWLGNPPYKNTLSIECTHIDWSGKMTNETYESAVRLCVYLCRKYKLTARHLILHFDISGKCCHRWFVNNQTAWGKFRDRVDKEL